MKRGWDKFISSKRWDGTWIFVVTKILAAGAAVPFAFAWKDGAEHRVQLVVLGAVLYVVSFAVDALVKKSERKRAGVMEAEVAKARSEAMRTICNSFSGIPQYTTSFLAQVGSGDSETRPHLDRYFANVMDSLAKATATLESRVCLYLVDGAERPQHAEDSMTLLLCGNGIGRADPPRSVFDSTTDYGKFVIQRMNERKAIRVEDTEKPPAELRAVLDCTDKYYKTFVAVPVTYNDHEYGMLMIDSPQKSALTKDHEVIANLYGRFLGSGFHLVQQSPASLPRLSVPRVSVDSEVKGGGGDGIGS
ncbi:GAF domain-containing protein [Rhodococcus rhodnii]|uniref:GAF domain-containing protein n=1 Tax=Rhodococcus rhodnii TaxID=38312 RepID=A0A6P2C9X6_9NOCA|nr:GAF domain-containing protein [Rhodococcus rhodnii]TXG89443.1 GAF domain-containing protein [Rhodococcus rhodnii]